jgi:hypothetical protein
MANSLRYIISKVLFLKSFPAWGASLMIQMYVKYFVYVPFNLLLEISSERLIQHFKRDYLNMILIVV